MVNILIPLAGKNQFFPETDYPYPKPLIEINGKTMIEHVIDGYNNTEEEKQFIFIVNSDDCKKYHLDNVLNLLTDNLCKIIKIDNETKGAACSALMAIEYINNETKLIISNADQLFDDNLDELLANLDNSDACVISFDSVHPRWSYARVNEKGMIIETAEKRPISKHAIAGFYFFKKGEYFVESAMKMIKKDANINGLFFIAPTLNEMVLENKKLSIIKIENSKYHTFYTPQKIEEYERLRQC